MNINFKTVQLQHTTCFRHRSQLGKAEIELLLGPLASYPFQPASMPKAHYRTQNGFMTGKWNARPGSPDKWLALTQIRENNP